MKTALIAGIVLIALGIVSLTFQGISYHTKRHIADIGPIHATTTETHTVPLSPLLGGLALVGGVVLVALGAKQ